MVKFFIEDSFNVTNRGLAITGRIPDDSVINKGDIIFIGDDRFDIKSVENFTKSVGKSGDNFAILIDGKVSKEYVNLFKRTEALVLSVYEIRKRKLDELI
jgi:translation elongation factor EF-Tu-like GTPase